MMANVKFHGFEKSEIPGDNVGQEVTVDGELVAEIVKEMTDVSRSMRREYRVSGYSVTWFLDDDDKRDHCFPVENYVDARAALQAAKDYVRGALL